MLAPLLLLGLGAVAVAAAVRGGGDKPVAPPASPPPPPPSQLPPPLSQAEGYFDTAVGGVKVFKDPYRAAILSYLDTQAVELPIPNDVTTVRLVPKKTLQDASARQWVETMGKTRSVLAVRWMAVPDASLPAGTPKTLRAVAPGEEGAWAGQPTSVYAVLIIAQNQPLQNAQGPLNPSPAPAPPSPGSVDVFAELPAATAEEVRGLMRDGTDPTKLVLMADMLEGKNPAYAKSADALRKRAKELQMDQETRAISQGRVYIVRPNDLQSELAQWFTGNANRWRELGTTNPKLRLMRAPTGDGKSFIEYFAPWISGDRIILPVGWDVSKGLPPNRLRSEPRAA